MNARKECSASFLLFWLFPSSIHNQGMAADSSQGSSETKTEIFLPGRFLPEMHRLMSKQSGGIVFAQYYLPFPIQTYRRLIPSSFMMNDSPGAEEERALSNGALLFQAGPHSLRLRLFPPLRR